jgi:hypothetical protein
MWLLIHCAWCICEIFAIPNISPRVCNKLSWFIPYISRVMQNISSQVSSYPAPHVTANNSPLWLQATWKITYITAELYNRLSLCAARCCFSVDKKVWNMIQSWQKILCEVKTKWMWSIICFTDTEYTVETLHHLLYYLGVHVIEKIGCLTAVIHLVNQLWFATSSKTIILTSDFRISRVFENRPLRKILSLRESKLHESCASWIMRSFINFKVTYSSSAFFGLVLLTCCNSELLPKLWICFDIWYHSLDEWSVRLPFTK